MLKNIRRAIIILLIIAVILPGFTMSAMAEATGKLNVFTDLKGAEIYIDAKLAGEEAVVGYVLPVGTHFVKVVYEGKTVYAKTIEVYEGRTNTITSDNFVEIKTSTPSRGAVDVEAERLREYRGNACFGVFGSSPISGLSVKWWYAKNMGIQAIGYAETNPTFSNSAAALRLLWGFPQKIFLEEVLDAYAALGYGRYWHTDQSTPSENSLDETYGLYFGLEAKVGPLANAIFSSMRFVVKDTEGAIVFLSQLVTLGLLNMAYTSFEIGIEQKNVIMEHHAESAANMKFNLGLHYYF